MVRFSIVDSYLNNHGEGGGEKKNKRKPKLPDSSAFP